MKEEKNIVKRCGKETPFTVPEGYFDTLTARVMANIPSEETKIISIAPKKTHWMGWTSLAAACIVGALVCINVFNNSNSVENSKMLSNSDKATEQVYDEKYQQEVMDYAMVDNNDVYNYLSGSEF